MSKKYVWVIKDIDDRFETILIPHGQITEENIKNLLSTLAAKYDLKHNEIKRCFLKRNTREYWNYLEVQRDSNAKFCTFYCQEITARCVPEEKLSKA